MRKFYYFLGLILLLMNTFSAFANFNDVSSNHPNNQAIDYVKQEGIVSGYPDGTFKADKKINRAELTKIIIEATVPKSEIYGSYCFPDVKNESESSTDYEWYAKYVCTAKRNGIIAGYPDGNFKPSNNISFVEASKIILSGFKYSLEENVVWYKPFVDKLSEKKSIPTSIQSLGKEISRGEMAEMIYRLKENVTTKESMAFSDNGLQNLANATINENPITKKPTPIQRTNYVVIVKSSSDFKSEAQRFANSKNATMITYTNNFNEVLNDLKSKKPIFTAVVATPEDLTPDFIGNVDTLLRNIDSDPYIDTSFGIITSRNNTELKKYVDKLINYNPVSNINVYGVSPKYTYKDLESDYGIILKRNCLSNCGGAICVCDDKNRATLERVKDGIKNANVLIFGTHGSPSSLILDNNEQIRGSNDGLYGGGKQDIDLSHNSILSIAESCLTGRINGLPTNGKDMNYSGNIDTSLVLSFLQSGTLNYIASTDIASTAIMPDETIIEESILQKVPIGTAIKDLKNRYIMVTESYDISMPGAPINNDYTTRDSILFQLKNWSLFGDPSIVLSNKQYEPRSCIKNITEKQIGDKKEVELQIQFDTSRLNNNSEYISNFEEPSDANRNMGSAIGASICAVKIPYVGTLKDIKVTPISGIGERYQNEPYPANAFYQDLGDEILISIPTYSGPSGKPEETRILQFDITTE